MRKITVGEKNIDKIIELQEKLRNIEGEKSVREQ